MAGLDFWQTIGTTSADVEHLYALILERGAPVASRELATHLIEWRVREEERRIAESAARGAPLYQPKQSYAVGQHLLFSVFDDREGEIVHVRAGENARYGNFKVIAVQFDGEAGVREFAADYPATHPLNQDPAPLLESLSGAEQAVIEHGDAVTARLIQRLSGEKEFVRIEEGWYLRGLLPQIHDGHLNLAEAAIEQANDAQSTAELLKIMDLPPTAKKNASVYALNLALASDTRFDEVGPSNEPRWYLTRLELPESRERPAILQAAPARALTLPDELETVAAELHDETDTNGNGNHPAAPRDEVTLVLTYPHRRAGTLPMTPAVRALVPAFTRPRLKITLVDSIMGGKLIAFAVNDGQYIAGMANWFAAHKLAPGAYVTLKRTADPLTLHLEYQPQRERSLWVRVARGLNGKLTFAQERRPVAHKYDEDMLILVNDPPSIDAVAQSLRDQRLGALLEEIFPELAKLSGAGRVHAKTLYSAVNLVRRAGPRTVLGALTESRAITSVGGGYFVLSEDARR
ncbi:MAG: hypothetical protein HY868_11955 [Chloroflexi bacterium]|nr:hypothetical protein [Chloroflexota bacterium]